MYTLPALPVSNSFVGTCRPGFKRDGNKCKKCPDSTTNKVMLAVGFIVLLCCLSFLVFITIKGSQRKSKGQVSATVSKEILNWVFLSLKLTQKIFTSMQ